MTEDATPMPQEIHPSTYVCDCGYRCEFSEGTVNEVRAASMKRRQELIADDGLHGVTFDHGQMVSLYCPRECREFKMKPR